MDYQGLSKLRIMKERSQSAYRFDDLLPWNRDFKIMNFTVRLGDEDFPCHSVVLGALFICVMVAFCLGFLALCCFGRDRKGYFQQCNAIFYKSWE